MFLFPGLHWLLESSGPSLEFISSCCLVLQGKCFIYKSHPIFILFFPYLSVTPALSTVSTLFSCIYFVSTWNPSENTHIVYILVWSNMEGRQEPGLCRRQTWVQSGLRQVFFTLLDSISCPAKESRNLPHSSTAGWPCCVNHHMCEVPNPGLMWVPPIRY